MKFKVGDVVRWKDPFFRADRYWYNIVLAVNGEKITKVLTFYDDGGSEGSFWRGYKANELELYSPAMRKS